MEKTFHIYTDGGCHVHTTKKGAWAYAIIDPDTEMIIHKDSGVNKKTTNQAMELKAAVQALAKAWDDLPQGHVVLHSDSAYVLKGVSEWVHTWRANNWKNSQGLPVKQQELWINFVYLHEILGTELKWIKGHSGNRWNEYVDKLATSALNTKYVRNQNSKG